MLAASASPAGRPGDEVDEAVLLGMAEPLLVDVRSAGGPLTAEEKTGAIRLLALAIRGARRASLASTSASASASAWRVPPVGGPLDDDDDERERRRSPGEILVDRLGVFLVGWLRAQIPTGSSLPLPSEVEGDTPAAAAAAAAAGGGRKPAKDARHPRSLTRHHGPIDLLPVQPSPASTSAPVVDATAAAKVIAELVSERLDSRLAALDGRLERVEDRLLQQHAPMHVEQPADTLASAVTREVDGAGSSAALEAVGTDSVDFQRLQRRLRQTQATVSLSDAAAEGDDDNLAGLAIPSDESDRLNSRSPTLTRRALLASLALNVLLLLLASIALSPSPSFNLSSTTAAAALAAALASLRSATTRANAGVDVDISGQVEMKRAAVLALADRWQTDDDAS